MVAACDQASSSLVPSQSPTAPAPLPTGATTISGTVNVSNATQPTSQLAAIALAADAPANLRVCVVGTDVCVAVDGSGHFVLSGDFTGDVHLRFTGSGYDVEQIIHNVESGETITITVEFDGDHGVLRIESRDGTSGDDGSDDGEVSGPEDDDGSESSEDPEQMEESDDSDESEASEEVEESDDSDESEAAEESDGSGESEGSHESDNSREGDGL